MRKVLITICLISISLILAYGTADAKVSGVCSDCHTMHNSQGNATMNFDNSTTAPQGALVRGDCLGCHGQGNADNLAGTSDTIPQVLHTAAIDLAGGNFAYITGDKSRNAAASQNTAGHNVVDLGVTYNETVLTTPPGDENTTGITNLNLTCAGQYGCHGDRTKTDNYSAVSGGHHADDSVLQFSNIDETGQGGTVATSYRFLLGVKGGEDADWQATVSQTDHNEYKGATAGVESTATSPGGGTISGLCGECHGNFHGTATDTGGPTGTAWERHPTDISLPNTGEYATYNPDDGNLYSLEAPVARVTIPGTAQSAVTVSGTDDDIVMCLSCHRAHASQYPDMLRWLYTGMNAGTGTADTGCFTCHTSKNAD